MKQKLGPNRIQNNLLGIQKYIKVDRNAFFYESYDRENVVNRVNETTLFRPSAGNGRLTCPPFYSISSIRKLPHMSQTAFVAL